MVEEPKRRRQLALTLAVAGLAVALAPSLLQPVDGPSAVLLVAVAVATAAVVLLAGGVAARPETALASSLHRTLGTPVPVAGGATDPPHHPLRPRAPGQV